MTHITGATPLKPVSSFLSAATVWAILAALVFGLVAGQLRGTIAADGTTDYSWAWFLGGFALSGILFLPVVMAFEVLRRVAYNQRVLGAKLDAIRDPPAS